MSASVKAGAGRGLKTARTQPLGLSSAGPVQMQQNQPIKARNKVCVEFHPASCDLR